MQVGAGPVLNFQDEGISFLIEKTTKNFNGETIKYYVKNYFGQLNTFPMGPANETARLMPIPGIILEHWDAIYCAPIRWLPKPCSGQGEALDCYNAFSRGNKIKNRLCTSKTKKIWPPCKSCKNIEDPVQRAEMYVKMFNPPTANTGTTV